ncbi:MAG: TrkH family potassium uptake protein [Pseudomonadota bacterium]
MRLRPILFVIALFLCILALLMLLPAALDLADGNPGWVIFLTTGVISFFVGSMVLLVTYDEVIPSLGLKDLFAITAGCWLALPLFASLPFLGLGLDVTSSFFEAMSGLTGTGATTLEKLNTLPRGILFWRALLNWTGGFAIILMAMIVMPYLRVGGMQLFQSERSVRAEKLFPRALSIVSVVAGLYLSLTLLAATVFMLLGMTTFDAICHAMATMSTGGFSTHDESIGFFKSPAIEWAVIVFMTIAAMPYFVFIAALKGDSFALPRDSQVRGLLTLLLVASGGMALWLIVNRDITTWDAIRRSVFNVSSILTTTGFRSGDYDIWGPLAFGVFFLLMFVGGTAGSTAGGMKIFRLQIATIITRSHVLHLLSPNRIIALVYDGRRLASDVPFSIVAFLVSYIGTVGLVAVVLSGFGLEIVTAISSAASAVGNVGPGLGPVVGPGGSFADLPQGAKWTLALAMLFGRLELFTLLVLVRPEFWRG